MKPVKMLLKSLVKKLKSQVRKLTNLNLQIKNMSRKKIVIQLKMRLELLPVVK